MCLEDRMIQERLGRGEEGREEGPACCRAGGGRGQRWTRLPSQRRRPVLTPPQHRARLPHKKGTGKDVARPRGDSTTTAARMTSTVYYSYMNGPGHRPSAIPRAHRDKHSHNPFPTPESCPVIHSRQKVPVRNTGHRSPSSGGGVSPSHGWAPLGAANRAAGTLSN